MWRSVEAGGPSRGRVEGRSGGRGYVLPDGRPDMGGGCEYDCDLDYVLRCGTPVRGEARARKRGAAPRRTRPLW